MIVHNTGGHYINFITLKGIEKDREKVDGREKKHRQNEEKHNLFHY